MDHTCWQQINWYRASDSLKKLQFIISKDLENNKQTKYPIAKGNGIIIDD